MMPWANIQWYLRHTVDWTWLQSTYGNKEQVKRKLLDLYVKGRDRNREAIRATFDLFFHYYEMHGWTVQERRVELTRLLDRVTKDAPQHGLRPPQVAQFMNQAVLQDVAPKRQPGPTSSNYPWLQEVATFLQERVDIVRARSQVPDCSLEHLQANWRSLRILVGAWDAETLAQQKRVARAYLAEGHLLICLAFLVDHRRHGGELLLPEDQDLVDVMPRLVKRAVRAQIPLRSELPCVDLTPNVAIAYLHYVVGVQTADACSGSGLTSARGDNAFLLECYMKKRRLTEARLTALLREAQRPRFTN